MNIPRFALLLGSGVALFGQSQPDKWQLLGRDRNISLYAERAWYGAQEYYFYIHVRVCNTTDRALSVDLRDRFETFYPNQWTLSLVPHRLEINERRAGRLDLDAERIERLLAGFRGNQLTEIQGLKSIEYYIAFNAKAPKADDIGKFRYLIVSMAGQLFYTDGTACGTLFLELPFPDTDLAIALPAEYNHIPPDAKVFQ